MRTLEAKVDVRPLPLSQTSLRALRDLDRYDLIVFTSKNAYRFFAQELRKRRIATPHRSHIVRVGPRADLLKLPVRGKRILFPRSDVAPHDIVRRLRAKGARVRTILLYTTQGAQLSRTEMKVLKDKKVERLYFKSPSGITGFLQQLSAEERRNARAIPALCIGKTTAQAARNAGFKHISIKGV